MFFVSHLTTISSWVWMMWLCHTPCPTACILLDADANLFLFLFPSSLTLSCNILCPLLNNCASLHCACSPTCNFRSLCAYLPRQTRWLNDDPPRTSIVYFTFPALGRIFYLLDHFFALRYSRFCKGWKCQLVFLVRNPCTKYTGVNIFQSGS